MKASISWSKLTTFVLASFIILSFVSGVILLISDLISLEFLKLWKEFVVIVILFLVFIRWFRRLNILEFVGIYFLLLFAFGIVFLSEDKVAALYQVKADVILFIYTICIISLFQSISYNEILKLGKRLIQIFFVFICINSCIGLMEVAFARVFMAAMGLEYGNWGNSAGVKVISQGGFIRAPGLLPGFVSLGSLTMLGLTLLNNKLIILKKHVKIMLFVLFFGGLLASGFKNGLIGLMIILGFSILKKIPFNRASKYIVNVLFFLLCFSSFFYSVTSYSFSDWIANNISKYVADHSIAPRIYFHHEVINDISESITKAFFGLGYGVNGFTGADGAIPLDSNFVYLLSNYGLIGIVLFTFSMSIIIIYLWVNKEILGVRFYLVYALSVEFFYNNTLGSYPTNYLLVTIVVLSVFEIKKRIELNE